MDFDLHDALTVGHELIDEIGWSSAFLPSVLPKSETYLQCADGMAVLEMLSRFEEANHFKGVLDLALAIVEPDLRPVMLEFYERGGPSLDELRGARALVRIDKKLERWMRGMAEVYAVISRDLEDVEIIEHMIRQALIGSGYKVRPLKRSSVTAGPPPPQPTPPSPLRDSPAFAVTRRLLVMPSREVVYDRDHDLLWQRTPPPHTMNWTDAKRYARELELDGGGWRLPQRAELVALRLRQDSPFVDEASFPNCPRGWFWTNEVSALNGFAWAVSFVFDDVRDCAATWSFHVRCVRGGGRTP